MATRDIGDTFFIRSEFPGDGLYSFLWDIYVNYRVLRKIRKEIFQAHVAVKCQKDCDTLMPTDARLEYLQTGIVSTISLNESTHWVDDDEVESVEAVNDLFLNVLLFYNEMYYRIMEADDRH